MRANGYLIAKGSYTDKDGVIRNTSQILIGDIDKSTGYLSSPNLVKVITDTDNLIGCEFMTEVEVTCGIREYFDTTLKRTITSVAYTDVKKL